ncbi:hypothetical protein CHRYSEOSP005_03880 [Chryseobacterium sp. Alg-005]|uniref:GNAT family N-acetyltransferase n=1 Tax=Chryseobacterium sp. Alg-005 TaxID=3159516 RepID=UPI0035558653
MIIKLNQSHIPQIAKIQKTNLPSFLSAYPLKFIETFYEFQLKQNDYILLGEMEGSQLLGFVFGTYDVEKLYDTFIDRKKGYFIWNTFITLIFNPKYLLLIFAKYFTKQYSSDCKTQLVYIATDKSMKNKGIGKKLLQAFEKELKNTEYYELEVESNNDANHFYNKNGFFIVHTYNNFFEKKYLMGKKISAE